MRHSYRIIIPRSKTGTPINNPISQEVGEELFTILNGNAKHVFWTGNGEPASTVKYWHKLFKKLFDKTGIPKAHPHRLRDTFAVSLLEAGVPIREVSRALGHKSVTITERHYAKWTPDQQQRMDDFIAGTWSEKEGKRRKAPQVERPNRSQAVRDKVEGTLAGSSPELAI